MPTKTSNGLRFILKDEVEEVNEFTDESVVEDLADNGVGRSWVLDNAGG